MINVPIAFIYDNSIAREVDMEITCDVENDIDKVVESCYNML